MQETSIPGVFRKGDMLYTKNPSYACGIKVYNEKLITFKNEEFRSWNPYRSKLAAGIKKKFTPSFLPN